MNAREAYVAPDGFVAELREELRRQGVTPLAEFGRLLLCPGWGRSPAWAEDVWRAPQELPAPSIKKAAAGLKAIQRNWALLPTGHFRRAELIRKQLPYVSARPLAFPEAPPRAPLGGWTLIEPDLILASPETSSPFPHGAALFVEDREGPPGRAYLKLWEALTLIGTYPRPGELCLDLGAAPGSWTWALRRLGASVIAVDKAPLDPSLGADPGVDYRRDSAFGLRPRHFGRVDWLFSDVVCYPERLLALVRRWLEAGNVGNYVCTIKFQGETDFRTQEAFAAIPGSRLMHLHHNKHELTWINLESAREAAQASMR